MQRILFLWHSKLSYLFYDQNKKTHVREWLDLHPWVKCEGGRLLTLLWPIK